jgi:hypothetical protein
MEVSTRLTVREGRRFALTVGGAFLVLGTISAWRGHHLPPLVMWTLGGALIVAGLLVPGRLSGVHQAWMALARAISRVTAPIIISAMYFVVLTPSGVLMRVFGRNPLRHPEHDGGFWQPVASDGRSDLETQF